MYVHVFIPCVSSLHVVWCGVVSWYGGVQCGGVCCDVVQCSECVCVGVHLCLCMNFHCLSSLHVATTGKGVQEKLFYRFLQFMLGDKLLILRYSSEPNSGFIFILCPCLDLLTISSDSFSLWAFSEMISFILPSLSCFLVFPCDILIWFLKFALHLQLPRCVFTAESTLVSEEFP